MCWRTAQGLMTLMTHPLLFFSKPEDDVIVLLVMNIRLPLNQSPLSLPQLKQLKVSWRTRTLETNDCLISDVNVIIAVVATLRTMQ